MPKIVAYLFALIFFLFVEKLDLFFHPPAFAASVNVNNVPTSLNEEQEFTVMVNISGAAANTTNYLRAAFYSETSPTSYFGYTFNHLGNWYNGSPSPIDPHLFLEIQIGPDGTWTGDLKSKADIASSAFKGSGNYYFKIGRYTASATSVSDWSGADLVSLVAPSPTPTPSPSPTPTPTPAPAKSPSPTPKVTPTPVGKSPSPTPKTSPVILGEKESQPLSSPAAQPSPSPSPGQEAQSSSSRIKVAAILTGSGAVIIGLSVGFYLWYKRVLPESGKEQDKDNLEKKDNF